MTRDPRGFRARAYAATTSGRVLGGRRRVRTRIAGRRLPATGATVAGRSVESAAAKVLAGSALIVAGLYLSFGERDRPLGCCSGWLPCAWLLEEWNNPATGIGSGVHDRTRRTCACTGCRCLRGPGIPTRPPGIATERLTVVGGLCRLAARPWPLPTLVFAPRRTRVPSVPAQPAAGQRQSGALRRSGTSGRLAPHRMDHRVRGPGCAPAGCIDPPDRTPDGSGPGRRVCVCPPRSRDRRSERRTGRLRDRLADALAVVRPGRGALCHRSRGRIVVAAPAQDASADGRACRGARRSPRQAGSRRCLVGTWATPS